MITRRVIVATPSGLQQGPAGRFCTTAAAQPARVTVVAADGSEADARSVLAVVGLGIDGGHEVTLVADGAEAGAETSVDTLAALLATDLDP